MGVGGCATSACAVGESVSGKMTDKRSPRKMVKSSNYRVERTQGKRIGARTSLVWLKMRKRPEELKIMELGVGTEVREVR